MGQTSSIIDIVDRSTRLITYHGISVADRAVFLPRSHDFKKTEVDKYFIYFDMEWISNSVFFFLLYCLVLGICVCVQNSLNHEYIQLRKNKCLPSSVVGGLKVNLQAWFFFYFFKEYNFGNCFSFRIFLIFIIGLSIRNDLVTFVLVSFYYLGFYRNFSTIA